jgi:hypothetical protein
VQILNTRLILQNGDAELWLKLCALGNSSPVRPIHILTPNSDGTLNVPTVENSDSELDIDGPTGEAPGALIPASLWPPGHPIGNASGGTDTAGLLPTNPWPWCVDARKATSDESGWIMSLPTCPEAVLDASDSCLPSGPYGGGGGPCFRTDDANRWAAGGAINAGLSVFLYVQSIENSTPPPDYNQCELLK